MNIVDCEHPIRVYNKYLGEYVWTSCGKCKHCRQKRASRWVARLEVERSQHPFCFFVTLTYSNDWLPILTPSQSDPNVLVDWRHSDIELSIDDLIFLTAADRQYFDDRIASFNGIPYASSIDIQKFHKRLNKYFHDNCTQTYQNFRFFTVSEYGSTTLRPHFHSIYFVDNQSVADNFEKGLLSCWKYGLCYSDAVKRSATSYVAQYINELFDLPSFYHHRTLRPFFLCSKRPPIGAFAERPEDFKEIFDNELITRPVCDPKDNSKIVDVPLLSCIKNRLFPKVKGFCYLSHSLRVEVYGLAARCDSQGLPYLRTFEDFYYRCWYLAKLNPLDHVVSMLSEYLGYICCAFTDKGINCLKRLYYVSKRVVRQCLEFGVTLEEYVSKIESYWLKSEMSVLSSFYRMQESFRGNSEDLVFAYHEFCYGLNPRDWRDLSSLSLSKLSAVPAYVSFCLESAYKYDKLTKSHFKNAYFEQIKYKNNKLFHLLNSYHVKNCKEIGDTFQKKASL